MLLVLDHGHHLVAIVTLLRRRRRRSAACRRLPIIIIKILGRLCRRPVIFFLLFLHNCLRVMLPNLREITIYLATVTPSAT